MIIYTHYSDSHKYLYENFFRPSLRKIYTKEQVLIKCTHHPQLTLNGSFMTDGWKQTMGIKIDVILDALKTDKEGKFIFADCDIQFFKPFVDDVLEELKTCDIACQEDRGSLCAGFFGCNINSRTLSLFEEIKRNLYYMANDQVALNHFKDMVKYKMLDKEKYYTAGNFFQNSHTGTFVWDNVTDIAPPKNMLLHHANYVIGVDNKINLLKMIRKNETVV